MIFKWPIILGLGLALVGGCAGQGPVSQTTVAEVSTPDTQSRLDQVWSERQNDSFNPDFAIGPGDVLEISAPDVHEIKDRAERVSANGTIDLPIAGEIKIGGLTEQQARLAIRSALSRLVKDPQLDVFVKEYVSREVAVIGMVNKPGLYSLNSKSDAILNMIGLAGGMKEEASATIMFIPAPPGTSETSPSAKRFLLAMNTGAQDHQAPAKTGHVFQAEAALAPQASKQPINSNDRSQGAQMPTAVGAFSTQQRAMFIPVASLVRGSHADVPVRPGDVIIVPPTGNVMVQGWVRTPGAYAITPGLTTLGAITAAGGQLFSSKAQVLRANGDGQLIGIPVDLSKVEQGQERDVAVQAGDVVMVNRSVAGAGPYLIYSLFQKFGTGMALTAF
jgi:polysaccharide export outer membrane protein